MRVRTRKSTRPIVVIPWMLTLALVGLVLVASAGTANAQQAPGEDTADGHRAGAPQGSPPTRVAERSSRRTKRTRTRRSRSKRSRTRRSGEITVPVDVGAGPAFFVFGNPSLEHGAFAGPVVVDQFFHYGLRLSLAAVIDHEFIKKHPGLVPPKYRRMFEPGSVVYYRPAVLALVPRNLIISPKLGNTGIYGATWDVLGLNLALITDPVRWTAGASLVGTYAFIDSDAFASPTHFLRPGVDLGTKVRVPLGEDFALSLGWSSNFYLPQKIGGAIFETAKGDDALWHIGEGFLMLHYQFPYTTTL